MTEIAEPLAKFHAKVTRGGQFTFPYYTREYYGLSMGDFVEFIVRAKDTNLRGFFIARLGDKGAITIPKEVRQGLNIKQGDVVELIVVKVYRLKDILGDRIKVLEDLAARGYKIITSEEERSILYSYSITQV